VTPVSAKSKYLRLWRFGAFLQEIASLLPSRVGEQNTLSERHDIYFCNQFYYFLPAVNNPWIL